MVSSDTEAWLIAIGFLFVVIILPVIYYMKTHTLEQQRKEQAQAGVFLNFMLGLLIVIGTVQYIRSNGNYVTVISAILSGLFVVISLLLYKFYSKRYGNSKTNMIYVILIDILALTNVVFYFIGKHV